MWEESGSSSDESECGIFALGSLVKFWLWISANGRLLANSPETHVWASKVPKNEWPFAVGERGDCQRGKWRMKIKYDKIELRIGMSRQMNGRQCR